MAQPSTAMFVTVTSPIYARILDLQLRREIEGDAKYLEEMAALLDDCCKRFGGTFDRDRALLGEETAVRVISPQPPPKATAHG